MGPIFPMNMRRGQIERSQNIWMNTKISEQRIACSPCRAIKSATFNRLAGFAVRFAFDRQGLPDRTNRDGAGDDHHSHLGQCAVSGGCRTRTGSSLRIKSTTPGWCFPAPKEEPVSKAATASGEY